MNFINRQWTKLIFSENPNLNITAHDMGERQVTISITKDSVKRLDTATRAIGSLEIYVPIEAEIDIAKDSVARSYWLEQYKKNGYIGGNVTFYDDTNNNYVATEPSITLSNFGTFNGTEAHTTFKIQANFLVNTDALAGF